jgi:hypothetical protein
MADLDYRQPTLSTMQMVFNRTRFLDETDIPTQTLIKDYIWELMNELEGCFRVSILTDGTVDDSRIGQEQYYTIVMRTIIADLVATYVLMYISGLNSQGSTTVTPSVKFLKRAKAGDAEVEWGQVTIKDSAQLFIQAPALIDMYRRDAMRKARGLGCILDICEDCTGLLDTTAALPFLVVSDCGCGC